MSFLDHAEYAGSRRTVSCPATLNYSLVKRPFSVTNVNFHQHTILTLVALKLLSIMADAFHVVELLTG